MKLIVKILAALACAGCVSLSFAQGAGHYVDPKLAHASYGDIKIVVPLTSDDPNVWKFKMNNSRAALDAGQVFGGHVNIVFVLYGRGVELLRTADPEILHTLDAIKARGVRVTVCNNTLHAMDLDYHALHEVLDSDVVPSGFLEVAYLQTVGFVVDPQN